MELEYSPAAWHPDRETTLKRHAVHGEAIVKRLRPVMDVRYGPRPMQTMDIFRSGMPGAPVCILIHGGYWRTSDKRFFHFLGEPLVAAGITCFIVNFDLCPAVSLDEIVGEVRDAIAWVQHEAAEYGAAPDKLYLLGHATGAHLAAMALACDWKGWPEFNPSWVRGSLLISGLYDLRCLPSLSVNRVLGLTTESALRNSPLLRPFHVKAPILIAAAAEETPEFIAQSRDMAAVARAAGIPTELRLIQGSGHFTVLDRLSNPESELMREFLGWSSAPSRARTSPRSRSP